MGRILLGGNSLYCMARLNNKSQKGDGLLQTRDLPPLKRAEKARQTQGSLLALNSLGMFNLAPGEELVKLASSSILLLASGGHCFYYHTPIKLEIKKQLVRIWLENRAGGHNGRRSGWPGKNKKWPLNQNLVAGCTTGSSLLRCPG